MRRACLISGCMLLGVLWLGPLPDLAGRAFFAHMMMHMGVVAVASPLIAAGLPGVSRRLARGAPIGFHPVAASVVELIVVWCWHAPELHHFARSGMGGLIVEQGSFLAAGLFVWMSALGGRDDRGRAGAGVIGLLLTAMHMTLLGALLSLAGRPLYHTGGGAFGMSALEDQHLGGAIMLLVGGASYLAGGLWLTSRLVLGTRLEAEESP